HEIRVTLDDRLDSMLLRKLRVVQLKDDFRPAIQFIRGLDLVSALPVACPNPAGFIRLIRPRIHRYFIRDHERGIKSDAELTDEIRVSLARLDLLEERLRAAVRNRAEVVDQFAM